MGAIKVKELCVSSIVLERLEDLVKNILQRKKQWTREIVL